MLPEIDVRTAAAEPLLLDVREQDEWDAGHAPNAVHLPLSEFLARIGELPAVRPLSVVCRVGGRSAQVTAYLLENGVDARNVEGGMLAWAAAGLPVVADHDRPAIL